MLNTYCVIVDPYISVKGLYNALIEKGITPIAVLTDIFISKSEKNKRFPKDKFMYCYDYSDPALIDKLSSFNIIGVIPGYEGSLDVADKLADLFCPQISNPRETTLYRNHKFYMQEQIRKKGINAVKQMKISINEGLTQEQSKELITWKWPLISKPVMSFCSYGVKQNSNIDILRNNLQEIKNSLPRDYLAEEMVIQESLKGIEYFVDSVSLHGHHIIVSVYRYKKTMHKNNPIYRYAEIIDCASQEASICIDYVKSVLDAVELNNGLAHTELFLTADGPYLIEVNPRISGAYGYVNTLASLANKRHQAVLLAESLIQPDQFLCNYNTLPVLSCYGRLVFVQSWRTEIMSNFNKTKLMNLPSYRDFVQLKSQDEVVHEPTNLNADTIGILLLVHSRKHQVEEDYKTFLALEENGSLFRH